MVGLTAAAFAAIFLATDVNAAFTAFLGIARIAANGTVEISKQCLSPTSLTERIVVRLCDTACDRVPDPGFVDLT